MAYFYQLFNRFFEISSQTQKIRLPQQPKNRRMESLVSGSF